MRERERDRKRGRRIGNVCRMLFVSNGWVLYSLITVSAVNSTFDWYLMALSFTILGKSIISLQNVQLRRGTHLIFIIA